MVSAPDDDHTTRSITSISSGGTKRRLSAKLNATLAHRQAHQVLTRPQELYQAVHCDNMANARPEATVNRKLAFERRAPFTVPEAFCKSGV